MKLVDMKEPKRKRDKNTTMEAPMDYDREKYPYGLRLRLENEQIKKIKGIKDFKVGDTVSVIGTGKITTIRISEDQKSNDHSIEIQLEKIAVSGKKALKDMGMKEYSAARDAGKE